MVRRYLINTFLILFFATASAQDSLQQLMNMHAEAHQPAYWEGIKTVSTKGFWLGSHGDYPVTFFMKRPNKFLMVSQRSRFLEAYNGIDSWTIAKWTSDEAVLMTADEALIHQNVFIFGTPVGASMDMVYKGKISIEDQWYYWIMELRGIETREYFISADSYLLFKTIITRELPTGSQKLTREVVKYTDINGLIFATHVKVYTASVRSEYIFSNITIGTPVDDKRFINPLDN
ncbi:MAG: hypothetical protein HQ474_05130 [Flammeovirgaceae bacterium]|jgi:hypothetical protein|nr:hypothetical protein [Flammeovirgaceae bacterium]NQW27274.1 hypothetical protein [Flammeovirgaceae bacterium]|tara:strand:+ start:11705 stop:12400 length:696 start_codon:yes stop_codon:yes gene_type:complete